jgi:hypothetical protein
MAVPSSPDGFRWTQLPVHVRFRGLAYGYLECPPTSLTTIIPRNLTRSHPASADWQRPDRLFDPCMGTLLHSR